MSLIQTYWVRNNSVETRHKHEFCYVHTYMFVNTGPMLPQNFNYVKKWKSHCEKM